jgi:hypothetical protein
MGKSIREGARAQDLESLSARYHRRMPEVNEAIVATYLAGGNTRRIVQPRLS